MHSRQDDKTDPVLSRAPDFGALAALMRDPAITDIMINDHRNVMVEKEGKSQFSGLTFKSAEELQRLLKNLLAASGKTLDPSRPYLDASLPDGSRINIVVPPITTNGPCITIRKFPTQRLEIDDLVGSGTLDTRIAQFLSACVTGKRNILILGGTGSGKTTLLNALSRMIPQSERIVTIEDTYELSLQHPNHVHLLSTPEFSGKTPVSARELVANSLRMRPDRIIVGECRRGEAFDMLQAMNTGHQGSMTTLHANSARDGLFRLETLCLMSGVEIPLVALRKQINSAIDLVVQIRRFRDGKRRITQIAEVTGLEGDTITLQDIFRFDLDAKKDSGRFVCTGLVPTFLEKLAEEGVELPKQFFS